jgi:hypothetical protein
VSLLSTLISFAVQIHCAPENNFNSDDPVSNPKQQNLDKKYFATITADRTTVFLKVQIVMLI